MNLRRTVTVLICMMSCCSISAIVTYWVINPTQLLNATQAVALDEYLKAYCITEQPTDRSRFIGTTSALSRVVIRANLGPVALAEYEKCRMAK